MADGKTKALSLLVAWSFFHKLHGADVSADFSMAIEIGGETFHKEPNLLEQIACRDTWGRGADSFIAMIYERRDHRLAAC
jgi:hypothetical protein